jgi:hypothetical protein
MASTCRSAQEIAMLLTLMITSKGIAGVPRASLVVITATSPQFNIPEAGMLLILASTISSTWAARRPTSSAMRWRARWWRQMGRPARPARARRHRAAPRAEPRHRPKPPRGDIRCSPSRGPAARLSWVLPGLRLEAASPKGRSIEGGGVENQRARPRSCGSNPRAGCRTCRADRFPARSRSTCRAPAASSRHGRD